MKLKMTVKTVSEAFDYKDQITAQGLHLTHDYTWRYTPAVRDFFGDIADEMDVATVEFEFVDPKWTTYFQLKWGV